MTKQKIKQALLLQCLLLCSFQINAEWFAYEQTIMGTRTAVELHAETEQIADKCSQLAFNEMKRIDALMSPYKENSELSKINREASDKAVKISPEFFNLLQRSIEFSEMSDGAFDITFASIGFLYDYRNNKRPSDEKIGQQLDAVNYKNIKLDETQKSVFFSHKNTKIDLGGIAKGHAVDNAINILSNCSIKNALVTAGGDSRILGDKIGRPWVMGVKHPRDDKKVVVSIPLSNAAISTSGDYERFYIEDGKRYHHILQPSTGKSVDHSWSVSVLANDALTSDALSTTLFVLGTKKALQLINSLKDIEAIVIDSNGKMFYSSGLMPPERH